MNEITAIFSGTRVGAYCIRPTNDHDNGRMDGKIDGIFIVRVGAYCIRPTNGYTNGRMDGKIDRGFGLFLSDESKIGSELISFGHRRGGL